MEQESFYEYPLELEIFFFFERCSKATKLKHATKSNTNWNTIYYSKVTH